MKTYKKVCIIIVLMIGFIFVNSAFSHNLSFSISEGIENFIHSYIQYGKYKFFDFVIFHLLRKIAHFIEYFILGIIIYKFYLFRKNKLYVNLQKHINCFLIFFWVAFLDETIQIFSGRGSSISDMWIDLFGCFCAFIAMKLYYYLKDHIKLIKFDK